MSVLNQSGEEQVECPLCMEPLEVDDLNFFPCTCGYQICRFCWHRIRTDENGLCPACRKAYSEDPADFIPLSREQLAKLKAEKRQRDQQRKAKLTESRKHLASVRVVQKNLVFVVGLPMRLADPEILKRHEYFGKFGKIHKVVINQSTSYAGSQGPSASAYVTYMKSDDALRAIQSVNNIIIDGRIVKSSLGTTKYCSHFMKNQPCPKPDCMYLHEYGDSEASFTKEQMHAGKHQEYEKKLHEELNARTKQQQGTNNTNGSGATSGQTSVADDNRGTNTNGTSTTNCSHKHSKEKEGSSNSTGHSNGASNRDSAGTNKENWPQLNLEKDKKEKGKKGKTKGEGKRERKEGGSKSNSESSTRSDRSSKSEVVKEQKAASPPISEPDPTPSPTDSLSTTGSTSIPKQPILDDNSSFFSSNSFQKISPEVSQDLNDEHTNADNTDDPHTSSIFTDNLPNISTTEDWAAVFGFSRQSNEQREVRSTLDTFGTNFGLLDGQDNLVNNKESYNGFYDISKLQENLLDALSTKMNGFGLKTEPHHQQHHHHQQQQQQQQPHVLPQNGVNGLDLNMSKFFSSFQEKVGHSGQNNTYPNGMGHVGYHNHMLLHQKQLEEQMLMGKQGFPVTNQGFPSNGMYPHHQHHHQNGMSQHGGAGYMNGDNGAALAANLHHSQLYAGLGGTKQQGNMNRRDEDELDFDPIQETQKAFAELMAVEQKQRHGGTGRQMNGVIHSQNGGHLPPPPPGFLQQQPNTSHMNAFGSKFLPFLNMSNSQQHIGSTSSQSNWPSSFNSQLQQQKNINNTCNDWKVLDPAILSASTRHYQVPQMPPIRDQYPNNIPAPVNTQMQNGGPLRSFEFTNSSFSNFTQLPPNFNNFTHLNTQPNLNWFSSELNSQISSPPGFRSSQATKQQEC